MDREKVIKAYECCKNSYDRICEKCPYEKDCCHDGIPMFVIKKMVELLKEQEDEKKRIMKVIWDTLHEGLSIDTVADQDWVYERIRHRIEDT